jgi:hypothetical protein
MSPKKPTSKRSQSAVGSHRDLGDARCVLLTVGHDAATEPHRESGARPRPPPAWPVIAVVRDNHRRDRGAVRADLLEVNARRQRAFVHEPRRRGEEHPRGVAGSELRLRFGVIDENLRGARETEAWGEVRLAAVEGRAFFDEPEVSAVELPRPRGPHQEREPILEGSRRAHVTEMAVHLFHAQPTGIGRRGREPQRPRHRWRKATGGADHRQDNAANHAELRVERFS